jgi:hypothetical protein
VIPVPDNPAVTEPVPAPKAAAAISANNANNANNANDPPVLTPDQMIQELEALGRTMGILQ